MESTTNLPPVYQAVLDAESYEALLRDLSALDGELQVSVKHAETAYVDEAEAWTLELARTALESGRVRAIQIRYRHEDVSWVDTLLRLEGGYRLVRMAAP